MYSTCLFCHADLGRNAAIEAFPVGRRLAFDAARGRLWVVCARCGRWNLTPLEARWEAVEAGERAFREARARVATDQIGLARLADGTELIRIGRPQRPELAAWRYGDQLGSRRRRELLVRAGAATAAVAAFAAGPLVGGAAGFALSLSAGVGGGMALVRSFGARYTARRWVPDGTGQHLLIGANELGMVRLRDSGGGGWELRVPYEHRQTTEQLRLRHFVSLGAGAEASLTGATALEAARRLLPLTNDAGASSRRVAGALSTLDDLGGPERAFDVAAGRVRAWAARQTMGDTGALLHLPAEVRLALEMAAHESQERRALEGELALLETAWRDAEAIAAIADDLLLPSPVRAAWERLRGRRVAGDADDAGSVAP